LIGLPVGSRRLERLGHLCFRNPFFQAKHFLRTFAFDFLHCFFLAILEFSILAALVTLQ
jgi:hypothetical protein